MSGGYLFGFGTLIVFWIFSFIITQEANPIALAYSENPPKEGEGKKLSASKLQALIWTMITLFTYASIFGTRLLSASSSSPVSEMQLPDIPLNLLVLMGLSVATAAGSKGVTISYKTQGIIGKDGGGLTTNSKDEPDLVKTQMLVWTVVAAGIYLITVVDNINHFRYVMPDVEGALLVLMGASQGAYIGNKLVSKDIGKTPKLIEVSQSIDGNSLTLEGENFGQEQGAGYVRLNDTVVREAGNEILSWSDFNIQVKIPALFKDEDEIRVKINRDGEWSEEKSLLPVPDLAAKTLEKVIELVKGKFNLKLDLIGEVPPDTEEHWEVTHQFPAHSEGYRKQKDTEITLGLKHKKTEVPNLTGKTLAEAQKLVGGQFILLPIPSNVELTKVIANQNPDYPTELPYQSPITVMFQED